MKPIHMEWQDIGCSYNTSTGLKTVLQVNIIPNPQHRIDNSCTWRCSYMPSCCIAQEVKLK